MAEINVTPMVDVHAGAADHLHGLGGRCSPSGVPLDLPQTQAKSLDNDKEPLHSLGEHQG